MPQINKKYLYRKYDSLLLPDLMEIKVTDICKINDGKTVIRFKQGSFLFRFYYDVYLEDFNKHVVY